MVAMAFSVKTKHQFPIIAYAAFRNEEMMELRRKTQHCLCGII